MVYKPYTSSYIPSTVLDQDMLTYGRSPSSAKSRTFFDRVFPEEAAVEELMTPSYTPGPVRYIPRGQEDTSEGEGYSPDPSTLPQYEGTFLDSLGRDLGFGSNYDGSRNTTAEDIIEQGINQYSGTADILGDVSSIATYSPLAPLGVLGSALSGKSELDGINEYLASINAEPLSKSQIAKAAINPFMGLEDYAKQNAMDSLGFNNNRTDFSKSPEQARAEQDYLSNMDRNMTVAELSDQLNNPRSFDEPAPSMSVADPAPTSQNDNLGVFGDFAPTLAPTFSSDYYTTPQQNMTSAYDRPNSGTFSGGSGTQELIGNELNDRLSSLDMNTSLNADHGPASAALLSVQNATDNNRASIENQVLSAYPNQDELVAEVKAEQNRASNLSPSRSPLSQQDLAITSPVSTKTNNAISYTPVGPGTNNPLSPGWQRGMDTYWDNQNKDALAKGFSYGQDEYSKSLMSDLSAPVNVDNFDNLTVDGSSLDRAENEASLAKDPNSAAYSDFGLSGLLGGLTDQNISSDISRSRGSATSFAGDQQNKDTPGVLSSLINNNRTTQPEEKSLMSSLLGDSLFGGGNYGLDASGANKSMNDALNAPAYGPSLGYGYGGSVESASRGGLFGPEAQSFQAQVDRGFDSFGDFSDAVTGDNPNTMETEGYDETGGGSGKIVCTAMNHAYGFGSFRNAIWLDYAKKNLTKEHEIGYHAIFKPLIKLAYDKNITPVRKILEHVARHRTSDIWKIKRGRRDFLGSIYRAILEPICKVVGKIV